MSTETTVPVSSETTSPPYVPYEPYCADPTIIVCPLDVVCADGVNLCVNTTLAEIGTPPTLPATGVSQTIVSGVVLAFMLCSVGTIIVGVVARLRHKRHPNELSHDRPWGK